jgi:hypothetical protein
MEFTYSNNIIKLPNKELTILDKLVLDFVSHIDIRYVIISGYVAILFGRSRNTEDIDMFIEDHGLHEFSGFYNKIISTLRYYPLNAENAEDAYELIKEGNSLRFAEKGTFTPNFEIKFAKNATDFYSLENVLLVDLGTGPKLRISPLELAIAYKLFLGSEKDFADAGHLYVTFKDTLDIERLKDFISELPIKRQTVKKILGDL